MSTKNFVQLFVKVPVTTHVILEVALPEDYTAEELQACACPGATDHMKHFSDDDYVVCDVANIKIASAHNFPVPDEQLYDRNLLCNSDRLYITRETAKALIEQRRMVVAQQKNDDGLTKGGGVTTMDAFNNLPENSIFSVESDEWIAYLQTQDTTEEA